MPGEKADPKAAAEVAVTEAVKCLPLAAVLELAPKSAALNQDRLLNPQPARRRDPNPALRRDPPPNLPNARQLSVHPCNVRPPGLLRNVPQIARKPAPLPSPETTDPKSIGRLNAPN